VKSQLVDKKYITNLKKDEIIPNYHLLLSSSSFLFPIAYAFAKGKRTLFFATILALFGSLNYWRKPIEGYRKNIDLVTSNLSCCIYVYYGYSNIIYFYPQLIGWNNLALMIYFFNRSCKKYAVNDSTWVQDHFLFHVIITMSKIYIIYWT
jgi:hypothetical protein